MPLKIIHLVLGKANPERMNGVNKVAHQQAMHLHALGQDVEIWGITKNPESPVYPRPFPTKLFHSQPFYRDLDPKIMYQLSKLPRNSIFHIHGAFIADFYKVTRMLTEMKMPYVYTPHGAFNKVALDKNKWIKKLYFQRYEKNILREARKVQFLGHSEYEHAGKLMRMNNRVIIPNGQDFSELEFDFHKMHRKDNPVFGFCGRLDVYYKGLDLLIEGFAAYIKNGGSGELWIIGDGPDRLRLEDEAKKLRVGDRILFMGARYGKDKLNRIANMDVFCHPSRSEGSPTAVLEAAALGKPLIVSTATNVGQIVEQRGCGIHLTTTTAKSIEKACKQFETGYRDGHHTAMGDCARRMVKECFSWQNVAEQLLAIYKQK